MAMEAETGRPERTRSYSTPVYESDRWDRFTHRAGDIVVCTPPKSGTTWTQMICALLVHQSPKLPLPLTRLSLWIERVAQPIDEVDAELAAQPWRRVLKSHTPLDGLPYFEDVSYVVCDRDPRDAFLSMLDHFDNVSPEALAGALRRLGMPEGAGLPFPTEPNALFPIWQTMPDMPWTEDGLPLGSITHHAKTWWAHRHLPNVTFLHYADLTTDLDGEMRRLSAFLNIDVDEVVWPRLVEAASFGAMKDNADTDAPGAHLGDWKSNSDFFRRARLGEWPAVLSDENLALYERLSSERLDAKLKAWLEGGRRAVGDPKQI
jgi:aryl sulfotransferase